MTTILENDVLISRKQAAEKLGVRTRTIDRWREKGFIETVQVGVKRVMVSKNSLEAFLDQCKKRRLAH